MQGSPVHFELVDVSPVEKRLNVEVNREHVTGRLDQAFRQLARDVTLRGFRKGKAPRELLEKLYGKKVTQDVLNEILQDSLTYVGTKTPLRMASNPQIDQISEIKRGEPLRYSARLELFPQVELKDWEGLEVERRAAKATDEQVTETLERRRQDHREMVPIEGRETLATTDMVDVVLSGSLGPWNFAQTPIAGVDLSEKLNYRLPGLPQALVGIPVGAVEHDVVITIPDEKVIAKEYVGLQGTLKVTVTAAYEKRLPELDDEFAKDTGEAETLDELREKIRAQLLKDDEEDAKEEARVALVDLLLSKNPVPVPPGFLSRVVEQNIEHYRRVVTADILERGDDPRELTREALAAAIHGEAVRSMSREFALIALADQEKLDATPADVEMRLVELARSQDKSVARLKAEIQKDDPEMTGIRGSLRMEKALDLLESRAKIKEAGA